MSRHLSARTCRASRILPFALLGAGLAALTFTTLRVPAQRPLARTRSPVSPGAPPRAWPPRLAPSHVVPPDAAARALAPVPRGPLAGRDAERALAEDIERALGAPATIAWDRGRALAPRTIRISGARPRAGRPADIARELVLALTEALGDRTRVLDAGEPLPVAGRALVAVRTVEDAVSAIVELAAYADGLPIEDGSIRLELRRSGEEWTPAWIAGRFHPGATLSGTVSPAVEASLAERFPSVARRGFEARSSWRLVARETRDGTLRRAFEVLAAGGPGEARCTVIDAGTGEALASWPIACAGTAGAFAWEHDPGESKREPFALAELYVNKGAKRVVTKADGSFALTGDVTLAEGFSGPLVRVVPDGQDAFSYDGPADFTLLGTASDERSVHQDEAAAFVHVTGYNAYMRETYPPIARAAKVRFAVVVASPFENAFFTPTPLQTDDGESFPGYVDLGVIAGRSAARDGSVVQHEYTHALLNGVASLYGADEALGVNEGLADYFPCARAEDPRVGRWIHAPYIRALDDHPRKLVWPRDATSDPHRVGNIFNQALWRARTEAEQQRSGDALLVDQAVFGGVLRMPDAPTLSDARDAILAADEALAGGAHAGILAAAFDAHGIASGADDSGGASGADPAPDGGGGTGDVTFTAPRKHSYVVHVDETVTIQVEAVSASGARVTLAASKLPHATFAKRAGGDATGELTFTPGDEDRGRHTVTIEARAGGEMATATLTFVVRRRRS